jgi:hypothetical protein
MSGSKSFLHTISPVVSDVLFTEYIVVFKQHVDQETINQHIAKVNNNGTYLVSRILVVMTDFYRWRGHSVL